MERTWIRLGWLGIVLTLAISGAGGTLLAQPSEPSAVQRVDALTLSDSGNRTLLSIEGSFDPSRIPDVMLAPLGGENAFNIEIPGAEAGGGLPAAKAFPDHPILKGYRIAATPGSGGPAGGIVNVVLELQPGARAGLDLAASGTKALLVVLEGSGPVAPKSPAMESPEEMLAESGQMAEHADMPLPAESEPAEPEPAMMEEPPRSMAAPWQSRPTQVRVAVLDAAGGRDQAFQAAVMLMDVRRLSLERRIGMRVEVVNVSRAPGPVRTRSVVYYREGFLRPALALAEILPGDQALEPMPPERARRRGIDVEIWLGKDPS